MDPNVFLDDDCWSTVVEFIGDLDSLSNLCVCSSWLRTVSIKHYNACPWMRASHDFDFRLRPGHEEKDDVIDGKDSSLRARIKDKAIRTEEGMELLSCYAGQDHNAGHAEVDPFKFGGGPLSIEVKVRFKSFEQDWARVFDFRNSFDDSVALMNFNHSFGFDPPRISLQVCRGSKRCTVGGNETVFTRNDWDHIVIAINDDTTRIYRNGILGQVSTDAQEPKKMKRHFHTFGAMVHSSAASYFRSGMSQHMHGTVAYFRMFDGIELSNEDVIKMYARRDEFY
ncbi:hypothetical protein TrST_g6855 [Triparma strigata]|uniref:Uncharacterized protein n=1 Tax=Triparma strigata TaxID=1606541 RepID=A0A9W7BI94_9STRA|nr:hypothetical protein TrST_g6855 [Triparma strigata]